MITLSVILRKGKGRLDSKGRGTICFRVNADGVPHLFSTGIKLAPAHFDDERQKVLKSAPDYLFVSTMLAGYQGKAQKIIYEAEISEQHFDAETFSQNVFTKSQPVKRVDKTCFYNMLSQYTDANPMCYSVLLLYIRTGERLRELYPKLKVSEVGFEHLTSLRKLLRERYALEDNTIRNYIKSAKAVLHFAEKLEHPINRSIDFARSPTTETLRNHMPYFRQ